MSKKIKETIPDELLNEFIKIILEVNTIEEAYELGFSLDTMMKNEVVKKYKEQNIGEKLRKYLYVKKYERISRTLEDKLTEKDIVNILRTILKMKKYRLIGTTINKDDENTRIYNINSPIKMCLVPEKK